MAEPSLTPSVIDRRLEEWGDRLFRKARAAGDEESGLAGGRRRGRGVTSAASGSRRSTGDGVGSDSERLSANAVRRAIRDTLRPSSRQVMVKITGGGRGLKAMTAHLRYISRQGKDEAGGRGQTLEVTDERGERHQGAQAIRDLMEDWRVSGSVIPDESHRREAFHIIFSMPQGTRSEALREAVEETAAVLFDGHRYAMALHTDQGAPHVHVIVRAERRDGHRLNPRKADLDRWRSTFARELQARGIDALATRQVSRMTNRVYPTIWELKARAEGRLDRDRPRLKTSEKALRSRQEALVAWREISTALARSSDPADRSLAAEAAKHLARVMRDREPGIRDPGRDGPELGSVMDRAPQVPDRADGAR